MPAITQWPLSLWLIAVVDLAVLGYALRRAPLGTLARVRGIQHLFLGAIVALICLWRLRAGLSGGLEIHFLGITALTLLLGWDLAVLAGALVCAAAALLYAQYWQLLPLDLLCKVIMPALITRWILLAVKRKLPGNFFIYFFICAFLAGALCAAAVVAVKGAYLAATGVYPWGQVADEYFLYLPLVLFPEAFLNGTLMTGMLVYLPDWVRTFDSRHYLDGK